MSGALRNAGIPACYAGLQGFSITLPGKTDRKSVRCEASRHGSSNIQYFGTLGSTSFDQAVMPPLRFMRLPEKPERLRASIALALRPPILQWTTVSRLASISDARAITCP